jgi:hypothetical protein|tara:strand:+ start:519 stop:704 length:186 start_codon:yes stop_codon:yes gene_type:complete
MIGSIDKWIRIDSTNKMYCLAPFKYMIATISIVNAIPDLMPEANKFIILGVKKTIRNKGNI